MLCCVRGLRGEGAAAASCLLQRRTQKSKPLSTGKASTDTIAALRAKCEAAVNDSSTPLSVVVRQQQDEGFLSVEEEVIEEHLIGNVITNTQSLSNVSIPVWVIDGNVTFCKVCAADRC